MKRKTFLCSSILALAFASCGGGPISSSASTSSSSPSPKPREFTSLGHEIVEVEPEEGIQLRLLRYISSVSTNHKKEISSGIDELEGDFAAGDEIAISSSSPYIYLEGLGQPETLLYSPTGQFRVEIPKGKNVAIYPSSFKGKGVFSARIPSENELLKEHNLALNPFDVMGIGEYPGSGTTVIMADDSPERSSQTMFPHAYASVITRGEASFFARNAIDGNTRSDGHGNYPYESWGYDQKEEATFTLYFGRKVSLSSLGFILRHDTASDHDTYWKSVTVEYEGGSQIFELSNSGQEQKVELDEDVLTDYIRLKDIESAKTGQGFAALTEIMAYGKEIDPSAKRVARKGAIGRFNSPNGPKVCATKYSASEIKDYVDRANAWFVKSTDEGTLKVPMYDLASTETVKLGEFEWKDSVYYSGLTDYVLTSGDKEGYDHLKGIGEAAKYRCNSGIFTPHGDHYQIGETFMQLGDFTNLSYAFTQPKSNADWNIAAYPNVPPKVSGDHRDDNSRDWSHLSFWWCDALYMALNTYTILSRITGDDRYVETAKEGYDYAKASLYDEDDHLWHRDSTQLSLTNSQDSGEKHKVYWSRGNAWVFAALAKQLIYLDDHDYPDIYDSYYDDYLEMAESLARYQREDGLWNVSITPYEKYAGKEITGTCGFLYGYCVGLSLGVLDEATYLPIVEKGFKTIYEDCFVDDTDQLGFMQTVGYQPQNYVSEAFTSKITNEFGMGLFLLASSAYMRMCEDYEPIPLVIEGAAKSYYYS